MTENENKGGRPDENQTEAEKLKRERELEVEDYSWGEGCPTIENYSADWACPKGDYDASARGSLEEGLIGVHLAPIQKPPDKHYAAMCECPKCFSQFWFHVLDYHAETLKWQYEMGEFKIKPKK